jgi:hypothetical protein
MQKTLPYKHEEPIQKYPQKRAKITKNGLLWAKHGFKNPVFSPPLNGAFVGKK